MVPQILTSGVRAFVEVKNHPHDLFIGNISQGVQTISKLNFITHVAFMSV